jgi:hypothetical protein
MSQKTRAVRLPEEDEKLVAEFLKRNPIFDFSTLTRIALRQFISSPSVNLKAVVPEAKGRVNARNKI